VSENVDSCPACRSVVLLGDEIKIARNEEINQRRHSSLNTGTVYGWEGPWNCVSIVS
jgi:hypothetical protein